jgi:hypothetical protein
VSGKALYPNLAEDIIGGISRYKPVRNELLAEEASCAAGVRARNAATIADTDPASAAQDILQIEVLIDQSRAAVARALTDGDLDAASAQGAYSGLDAARANLSAARLSAASAELLGVCNSLAPTEGAAGEKS